MSTPPWIAPFGAALDTGSTPHRFALATVTPDGLPLLHSVALRGFAEDGTVWFLADERSDTVPYLRFNPNVELAAWFDAGRLEVRLAGRAAVHGEKAEGLWATLRRKLWGELTEAEKGRYLGGPPGRPLGPPPSHAEVPAEAPRDLVLISVQVSRVDWREVGAPDTRTVYRKLGPAWIEEAVYP